MTPEVVLERQKNILEHLNMLPRKMLLLHGHENITDLVLHELCHERCFNIDKAAYFIDNPDFDCLKGIAGHCRSQAYQGAADIWTDPTGFSTSAKESVFNQKVRGILQDSGIKHGRDEKHTVEQLAKYLDFSRHGFYSWPMKHDNHGIFMYERNQNQEGDHHDLFLPQGVVLLSFCPVF